MFQETNKKKIRVLHVIGGSLEGGAAKGAINLHNSLLRNNISSFVINNYEDVKVNNLIKLSRSKIKNWLFDHLDKIPIYLYYKRKKIIFSSGVIGENINHLVDDYDIDILHLHWINTGFINISKLNKIRIPIIWTMRDAWPFTGGCHIPMTCEKFINQCNRCEQLSSNHKLDPSFFLQSRKKNKISHLNNINFVAISPFLQAQAKKSHILKNFEIEMIENSVDLEKFKLLDKESAKSRLGIPSNKCIILIANDSGETWKGHHFLYQIVKDISSENIEFISFGSGIPCHKGKNFGFVSDIELLSSIYSSSDVFIFPSTYEPFGKVVFEAASCGSKIVSFERTGASDFYDNEEWWYLAEYANYQSLLSKTLLACNDKKEISQKGQRKNLLEKFDQNKIALKYSNLYERLQNT